MKTDKTLQGLNAYVPPQNIEAEQSTLGAMFIEKEAIDTAQEILSKDDFYRESHQTLFDLFCQIHNRKEPVDLITVQEELKKVDKLDQVGGMAYLTALYDTVPTASNVAYYAGIVLEKSKRRQLVSAALLTIDAARNNESVEDALQVAQSAVMGVGAKNEKGGAEHISFAMHRYLDMIDASVTNKDGLMGLSTGITLLDLMLGGLRSGYEYFIGGRPSMGKSALAFNIVDAVSILQNAPTLIFSQDMTNEDVAERLICARGRINSQKLRRGMLTGEEYERMHTAINLISAAPIHTDEKTGHSIETMDRECRRVQRETGHLGLIVVDYIQQMRSRQKNSSKNESQILGEIAEDVKALGKSYNCPILVLSQLSRETDKRSDKEPTMGDLNGSGGLEAAANAILFPFRPSYYAKKEENGFSYDALEETAKINIAKQKNGPTGSIEVGFTAAFGLFMDMAEGPTGY